MRFASLIDWAANSIPVNAIANLAATVKAFTLDTFAAPTASVNMNNQKLTGLANGTANTDAASKGQMDTADAATLSSAKSYADSGDATTLASAKSYTDGKVYLVKSSATITGNGTATAFDVVHNMNTQDVIVMVKDSSGNTVLVDAPPKSGALTTTVTVNFATAPANGVTYRVVVMG